MYSVLITVFKDDYKCRYGKDWSENEGPYFFSSYQNAQDYVCTRLVVFIHEHIDRWWGKMSEEVRDYFEKAPEKRSYLEGEHRLLAEFIFDLDVLDNEIIESDDRNEGEYVPTLIEWNIEEIKLDTKEVDVKTIEAEYIAKGQKKELEATKKQKIN